MINQRHSLQEKPADSALFEKCNYLQWERQAVGRKAKEEMQKAMTKKHLLQAITFCQGCPTKSKQEVQMKGPAQGLITKPTHQISCPTFWRESTLEEYDITAVLDQVLKTYV